MAGSSKRSIAMVRMQFVRLSLLLFPLLGYAQGSETQMGQAVREEAQIFAHRLATFIPKDELFASREFVEGYLLYRSGLQSEILQFNYNNLFSRMVFRSGADTLFMNSSEEVKSINTVRDQFHYDPKWGYMFVLAGANNDMRLAMQTKLAIRRRTQLRPTEHPSPVNTPEFFSTIYHPESYLLPREEVLLKREAYYYLISKAGDIHLANKAGFMRMFPHKKHEIDRRIRQGYAEHKRIHFTRLSDVSELFAFCTTD